MFNQRLIYSELYKYMSINICVPSIGGVLEKKFVRDGIDTNKLKTKICKLSSERIFGSVEVLLNSIFRNVNKYEVSDIIHEKYNYHESAFFVVKDKQDKEGEYLLLYHFRDNLMINLDEKYCKRFSCKIFNNSEDIEYKEIKTLKQKNNFCDPSNRYIVFAKIDVSEYEEVVDKWDAQTNIRLFSGDYYLDMYLGLKYNNELRVS
jgi:hypothetical protein